MKELSRDNFLVCKNSQGEEFRAVALRMSRNEVTFEVYNPYSIVQLSEVLGECKIYVNGRLFYSGRAVVSHLINTGVVLVCKATLEEADWLDVDLFASFQEKGRLAGELKEFLEDWTNNEQVQPEFKLLVSDMESLLQDLHHWLDQVELGIRSDPSSADIEETARSVIEELKDQMITTFKPLFEEQFETIFASISATDQPVHGAYLKRHLHPLILCSPFAYRVFTKPLGYAGDYEMVNMMLRNPAEGGTLFAKMLNVYFLNTAPVIAHQNRINYLVGILKNETQQNAQQMKKTRILNLGCGPAVEVQRFLRESDLCERVDFTLLDFNDETISYTRGVLDHLKMAHHRKAPIQFVQRSIHQILKQQANLSLGEPYDLVYCAGLFDYLSDRICKRLVQIFYDWLAPEGLLVVTNVHPSNPNTYWMEYGFEWHLIYRDADQMYKLHPHPEAGIPHQTQTDPSGVNLFFKIRKPSYAKC